jgi:hypothetical protein
MELTDSFLSLLQNFDPVFTAPTFNTYVVIVTGWILSLNDTAAEASRGQSGGFPGLIAGGRLNHPVALGRGHPAGLSLDPSPRRH